MNKRTEYYREYRKKNREKIKEYQKRYYHKLVDRIEKKELDIQVIKGENMATIKIKLK